MSAAIENYRKTVEQPWGRMFYDLIFRQLKFPDDRRMKILDFGAGFCLTADHYAEHHDVTAVEPNEEMYSRRVQANGYTLVPRGGDYLETLEANTFDAVICHNVLEYAEDAEAILKQLERVLKPGGILSVIKHNLPGRVFGCAVLTDDPKAALDLLNGQEEASMFGSRNVYSNETLTEFFGNGMTLSDIFGIRTFYGLSSNNEVKYTDEWYRSMLELETRAGRMDEYIRAAFFNHLIFRKN